MVCGQLSTVGASRLKLCWFEIKKSENRQLEAEELSILGSFYGYKFP